MDKGMDAEGEWRKRVLRPVPPISRTREEHRHHRACAARPQARTMRPLSVSGNIGLPFAEYAGSTVHDVVAGLIRSLER